MFDEHRVVTSFEGFEAFIHDCMREHRGCRRAVTGNIVGFGRGFLKELRAHILKRILEFDFLRNGNAVVRDGRGAEFAIDRHIAALRAQRRADRVGDHVHAVLQFAARFFRKNKLLCSHGSLPPELTFDDRENVAFAQDEQFLAIHLDLGAGIFGEQYLVADLQIHGHTLAFFVAVARTHRQNFAFLRLLFGGLWQDDPARSDLFLFDRFDNHASAQRFELEFTCHL